jgi:hypothetical protein
MNTGDPREPRDACVDTGPAIAGWIMSATFSTCRLPHGITLLASEARGEPVSGTLRNSLCF